MPSISARIFALLLFIMAPGIRAESIPEVARLSYTSDTVSLLPAEGNQWINASINRPLVPGDTLWVDNHAKAELELDSATLRFNARTSLKILNLDNSISQFQLSEGSMVLIIRKLKPGQRYEVDTPNLAFLIDKPGYYRIDVQNSATTLNLKTGAGEVYGQHSDQPLEIRAQKSCTFTGIELLNPRCTVVVAMDDFDYWVLKRENRKTDNVRQHVSQTVIGYQDLDAYGSWKSIPQHGYVWVPEYPDPDWAPYQDGHWIWLSQWGWTWVDNQPWGFAPFHYGRWIFINNHWAWVPGPANVEAWYAPALVVFLESGNDIIWFPLAPGEVYIPAFTKNQIWFNQINISNTYINNINYYYNNPGIRIDYRNFRYDQALTALSRSAFAEARPANISPVKIPREIINKAQIMPFAPVAPTMQGISGGKPAAVAPEIQDLANKPVVIKTPHPVEPAPFSKIKPELIKNPGKPLDIIRPETRQPMERLVNPAERIRPADQAQPLLPSHPVPIQAPDLNKPERIRPSGGMQQLEPPTLQPGPVEKPRREMQEIQPPTVRPAPVERPRREMQEIQPPTVRPAPVERPRKEMQEIQPPTMRPAPIERPRREIQEIQPPTVRPAPVEKPQGEVQKIQPPEVHPAPVTVPQKDIQPRREQMEQMEQQRQQQIEQQRQQQMEQQRRQQMEQQRQQQMEQQRQQQMEQQRQQQMEQQRQQQMEQQRQQQMEQQRQQQMEQQRQQQMEQQRQQQMEQQRQQQIEQPGPPQLQELHP